MIRPTSQFTIPVWKIFHYEQESYNLTRAIKEAVYIRVDDQIVNRKTGKYQCSHIWHEVLSYTLDLKLKRPYDTT